MWTLLNQSLNAIFDLWFMPLRGLPDTVQLAITALPVTLFALLVFRHASNQTAIVYTKNKITAYLLEFLLFNSTLSSTLHTQRNVIRYALSYLRHTLRPLALMLIPMVLVIVQVESRFGFQSLAVGESTVLTLTLEGNRPLIEMKAQLSLPPELIQATPVLRIEKERKMLWRLTAKDSGSYDIGINIDGIHIKKHLLIGISNTAITPIIYKENNINTLLYPAEIPIQENSPISAIQLDYPHNGTHFASLSAASWKLFALTMVFGLLLRRRLGVSF